MKKNADQKNDVHDWACAPTDRGRHCPRRRWLDRPASFYASSPEHLLICQSAAEAGPSTNFTVRYYSTFLPLNKHAEVSSWSLRCGSSSILSAFGVCCGLLIWSSATECWRAPCFFFFPYLWHEQTERFAAPDSRVKSRYDSLRRFSFSYNDHQLDRNACGTNGCSCCWWSWCRSCRVTVWSAASAAKMILMDMRYEVPASRVHSCLSR